MILAMLWSATMGRIVTKEFGDRTLKRVMNGIRESEAICGNHDCVANIR